MPNILLLLGTGFWVWMLIDCYRNEPERIAWGLLIFFFNLPAALVYCVIRFLPRHLHTAPMLDGVDRRFFNRWLRKSDLWQAEAAVRHIGKEQQYLELAQIQNSMGLTQEARQSYLAALEKSPSDPHILWQIASFEANARQPEKARSHLERLLQIDPEYRYGDASTLYGRVLIDLEQWDQARSHLESHIRRWANPESMVMLAELQIKAGNTDRARHVLDTMIANLRGGPEFNRKRNRQYLRRAERLLRQLTADSP